MNYLNKTTQYSKGYRILMTLVLIILLGSVGCDNNDESMSMDYGVCLVEVDGVFIELELDEDPEYLNGGKDGFSKEISMEIKYPAFARENSIEGDCIINYEITKEGKVENIAASQDPGGGIGGATVQTIQAITEGVSFTPGILNEVPVRLKKELVIKFRLEG